MLVMMLRTVTLAAPCRWCSSRTISSAVVPCAARRPSSQRERRRHARILVAQALDQLHRERIRQRRAVVRAQKRRRPHRLSSGPSSSRSASASASSRAGAAHHDALGRAAQVLDQHDAQRDRDRPQLADGERLDALIGARRSAAASPDRSGCRYARRRPRRCRRRADSRQTGRRRAWAAGGSSRAADRRGSRGSAPRRGGSCRAATRRPA